MKKVKENIEKTHNKSCISRQVLCANEDYILFKLKRKINQLISKRSL